VIENPDQLTQSPALQLKPQQSASPAHGEPAGLQSVPKEHLPLTQSRLQQSPAMLHG
jgi:hypothetical protein